MLEPTRITYKTIGEVSLDLHVFQTAAPATARRPAIVFFFGGGWNGGSPGQFYPHCRHLAELGMFACAAEYRVKRVHGTTPFECVADGRDAVRYLRLHADELGIDPSRIASGGGSAGGHVCLMTGTPTDDPNCLPNAMVAYNPVADTTPTGFDKVGDGAEEISPVHQVVPDQPPALIMHGRADTAVPIEQVERYQAAMLAAGNRCELMVFDGACHGFFNYVKPDRRPYHACVAAMDRFLASLNFLPV